MKSKLERGDLLDVLKQPHDKFFRSTFGQVEIASDFLKNYLPQELSEIVDIDTLELQNDTFLNEKLKEEFADLLFRVNINHKEGYVYFLFEHKSYKDRMVIFQVLKYMINIWESKIQDDVGKKLEIELPIILPLVVYHSEGKWNIKKTLGEMMPNYKGFSDHIKKYIPNFEYLLFDLSEVNKQSTKLISETMIIIKALSRTRYASRAEAEEILIEAVELIEKAKEKDQVTYYVSACIRYMLSVRSDISEKEMKQIAEQISVEGGELVMSVAEKLRQEGVEEGREKAREEENKITAKTMIVEGEPMDKIIRYSRLTKEEIDKIRKEIRENILK